MIAYFNKQNRKLSNAIVETNDKYIELESRLQAMEDKFNQMFSPRYPKYSAPPQQFSAPPQQFSAPPQQFSAPPQDQNDLPTENPTSEELDKELIREIESLNDTVDNTTYHAPIKEHRSPAKVEEFEFIDVSRKKK